MSKLNFLCWLCDRIWCFLEKFTPLAKILHCRRQWREWQIRPLTVRGVAHRNAITFLLPSLIGFAEFTPTYSIEGQIFLAWFLLSCMQRVSFYWPSHFQYWKETRLEYISISTQTCIFLFKSMWNLSLPLPVKDWACWQYLAYLSRGQ